MPSETAPVAADGEIRDTLPDDLDVTAFVGPYVFPDNARRRIQGTIHLAVAAVCLALWFGFHAGGVLANSGLLVIAGLLGAIGVYHFAAARPLEVRELDALAAASREVGFAIGHASAQMVWRGLLSTPTWRILLFSADDPPSKRGLVMVDGVDGEVLGSLVEDNPEDWSEMSGVGVSGNEG